MPMKSSTPMPDESAVRTRAYLMWEADGRPEGRADHYWSLAAAEAAATEKPKRAATAETRPPEKKAKAAGVAPKPAKAAKTLKGKKSKT